MHVTFLYSLSDFLFIGSKYSGNKGFHLQPSPKEKQGCQEEFRAAAVRGDLRIKN